jgi:hypothetical protein
MSLQGNGAEALSNYIKNTLIPSVVDIRASNIYDHELTDLGGFPAATITLQELVGAVLDNNRNQHIFRFTIRIFIDRNKQNFGSQKAETILRSLTNNLISKIDADTTLGGNCIIATPFSVKYGYIDREQQDIRIAEVTLDCTDANTYR